MTRHEETAPRTLLEQLMRQRFWANKDLEEKLVVAGHELGLRPSTAERSIRRWRSGQGAPTRAATYTALEHVFGVSGHALLGPPVPETAPGEEDHDARAGEGVHSMLATATADARRISTWLEATRTGLSTVEMYRDALTATSTDFLHRPVAEVFGQLTELRAEIFEDLEQRRHRNTQPQMVTVLGMTSAALAHACHLLGRPDEGMAQARLARQCADDTGHIELGAWACGTLALLAEGAGRLPEAIRHVRTARERLRHSPAPGTGAVRLACYEARILARMRGDASPVRSALAQARQAREDLRDADAVTDLDEVGGILHFAEAKADMFAGQVERLTGRPDRAEDHSQAAITAYLSTWTPSEASAGYSR